jgi:hypothetical protein
MKVLTFAVDSVARTTVRVVTKCKKRSYVAVSDQPDVSTLAAVSTVGSTKGHRAFATEADTACAAVSTADIQLGFVDKHTHRASSGYLPQIHRTCDTPLTYSE